MMRRREGGSSPSLFFSAFCAERRRRRPCFEYRVCAFRDREIFCRIAKKKKRIAKYIKSRDREKYEVNEAKIARFWRSKSRDRSYMPVFAI